MNEGDDPVFCLRSFEKVAYLEKRNVAELLLALIFTVQIDYNRLSVDWTTTEKLNTHCSMHAE